MGIKMENKIFVHVMSNEITTVVCTSYHLILVEKKKKTITNHGNLSTLVATSSAIITAQTLHHRHGILPSTSVVINIEDKTPPCNLIRLSNQPRPGKNTPSLAFRSQFFKRSFRPACRCYYRGRTSN